MSTMPLICAYCRRYYTNDKMKECPACGMRVFKKVKKQKYTDKGVLL